MPKKIPPVFLAFLLELDEDKRQNNFTDSNAFGQMIEQKA